MDPASPRPSPPERRESAAEAAASSIADAGCAGFQTARDARHLCRFNLWMLAAALAYVAATAALRWRGSLPAALPWLLAGLASVLAIVATRFYLIFLRGADELLRRIQIEALALGFGAGGAFSLLYPLLVQLGAPALDGPVTAAVMMLSWSVGIWLGTRRYSGSRSA